MRKRTIWISVAILTTIVCICLVGLLTIALLPRRGAVPAVKILFPPHGAQISLKTLLPVQIQAEIPSGQLRRLTLFADAQLIGNLPVNTHNSTVLWTWSALTPGDHTLEALAVSDQGKTATDVVRVTVVETPDRDQDGLSDDQDKCPDQAGLISNGGCPTEGENDRDGDMVSDSQDRCPDQYGLIENEGCPMPIDRDGDGIPDIKDRCPEVPGPAESEGCISTSTDDRDGDGIRDEVDICPDESGTLDSGGCPVVVIGDRDGDGIPDDVDACVEIAGDETHDGCPYVSETDRDGDGVNDDADRCPDDPGLAALDGCPLHIPPLGTSTSIGELCVRLPSLCDMTDITTDTDGDGVADTDDRCPEVYGPIGNDGCPLISPHRSTDIASNALLCILNPAACGFELGNEVEVTINLNENLYTDRDWLAVWCYVSGENGVWYRLPRDEPSLRRIGAQNWYLGDERSLTLTIHERSVIPIHAFCQALEMPFGEPQPLGQIVRLHQRADWNGTPFIIWSDGAANRFMIIYTMTCNGCE